MKGISNGCIAKDKGYTAKNKGCVAKDKDPVTGDKGYKIKTQRLKPCILSIRDCPVTQSCL